jgi:ribosome assembly protein SQT1
MQVAPADLEACLLSHPLVADCAVISVPHESVGEVPKAFVVKSRSAGSEESDASLKSLISRHVEKEKARYKWLHGGIEFLDVIPKSSSGKILRRLLREQERKARKVGAAAL